MISLRKKKIKITLNSKVWILWRLAEGVASLSLMKNQASLMKKRGSTLTQKVESRQQKSAELTTKGQRQARSHNFPVKVLNEHEVIPNENSDLEGLVRFLTDKVTTLGTKKLFLLKLLLKIKTRRKEVRSIVII